MAENGKKIYCVSFAVFTEVEAENECEAIDNAAEELNEGFQSGEINIEEFGARIFEGGIEEYCKSEMYLKS
jgi:uncharacterized membrane protein